MTDAPDLTLWHAPLSRSMRILWLLEEIGCPYRLELIDLTDGSTRPGHGARAPGRTDVRSAPGKGGHAARRIVPPGAASSQPARSTVVSPPPSSASGR